MPVANYFRLGPNFAVGEFVKSTTATRAVPPIDNSLPESLLNNALRTVAHIVQPVRDHFAVPFLISSGYRCLELNRALKSSDTSDHLQARAADIEIPGVPNVMLATWMADNLEFDQIILEFYNPDDPAGGWVHGSFRSSVANRKEVLTYYGGGRYETGIPII